ncbi:hypothetical protein BD309DRAFT_970876 [Dichomitus squalens]|nr:hypothetical protein BD309DRAFT_970876 [Dichomitus squalens]
MIPETLIKSKPRPVQSSLILHLALFAPITSLFSALCYFSLPQPHAQAKPAPLCRSPPAQARPPLRRPRTTYRPRTYRTWSRW